MNFAYLIFKFFASLRLAIVLLISLALAFAAGTFLESSYGADAAKILVYDSFWMSVLLVFLALNVAAAALDRLPWKKKHVGFVITHIGIIIILAGALVTRAYGVEGQMAIREGETASRVVLNQPLLHIFSGESGPLTSVALPRLAFSWSGRKQLYAHPDIWLLRYYPKASREDQVEEAGEGPAALHVQLRGSMAQIDQWLFEDDPGRGRILLGPAEIRFTREPMPSAAGAGKISEQGDLEFRFPDRSVSLSVDGNLNRKVKLKNTDYFITIKHLLKDAVVEGDQLVDRSAEWKNPAVEFVLEGKNLKENHTVFSNFPEFPTLHGMKPSQTGAKIIYHAPNTGTPQGNELRFVGQEGALPHFQIRAGGKVTEGTLEVGKETPTGWMDFQFQVDRYYPHARSRAKFREEPVYSQSEEHQAALELEIPGAEGSKTVWLGQGDQASVNFGKESFEIIYGLKTLPVGFRLGLEDFRVKTDPGSNRPASFESDVILKDDFKGLSEKRNIRMNHPLGYRGFKVFQSGYQQNEGEPEVSIFTVAKDPGIPVKYAGAVILISGTLIMFYSRKFSGRPAGKEREKVRAR